MRGIHATSADTAFLNVWVFVSGYCYILYQIEEDSSNVSYFKMYPSKHVFIYYAQKHTILNLTGSLSVRIAFTNSHKVHEIRFIRSSTRNYIKEFMEAE